MHNTTQDRGGVDAASEVGVLGGDALPELTGYRRHSCDLGDALGRS
jgi:hypothetical protein